MRLLNLIGLVPPKLHAEAQELLDRFFLQIRGNLLLLQVVLGSVFSLLFTSQMYIATWINHDHSPTVFWLYVLRIPIPVMLAVLLIRLQHVQLAWLVHILLNTLTVNSIIIEVSNGTLIVFALFASAGAAVVLSLPMAIGITVFVLGFTQLMLSNMSAVPIDWSVGAIMYASIMFGCMCIGSVLQRMLQHFASQAVTQRQRLIESSRQQAAIEQQLNDIRQRVRQFSLLNHDLRQPIHVAQGHLLGLEVDTESRTEFVLPALAATQRAERVLNNMLDLFRLEAGQQHHVYAPEATDLAALVAQICADLPGLARYHSDPEIIVKTQIDDLPMAWVDGEHLERALLNLLDNALAHADAHVALIARYEDVAVVFEVLDDGPGVTPSVIEHLLNAPDHPAAVHTGFGLLQVRATVQSHHGVINVSNLDPGCKVQIRLPLSENSPFFQANSGV